MQIALKTRVLGQAVSFVLIAPVLLFVVFIGGMKLVPGVHRFAGFVLFTLCGVAQVIALAKLEACKDWKFGWAKFGSYVLSVVALLLLFQFVVTAALFGYYILYPNAPMLFGGT